MNFGETQTFSLWQEEVLRLGPEEDDSWMYRVECACLVGPRWLGLHTLSLISHWLRLTLRVGMTLGSLA